MRDNQLVCSSACEEMLSLPNVNSAREDVYYWLMICVRMHTCTGVYNACMSTPKKSKTAETNHCLGGDIPEIDLLFIIRLRYYMYPVS